MAKAYGYAGVLQRLLRYEYEPERKILQSGRREFASKSRKTGLVSAPGTAGEERVIS